MQHSGDQFADPKAPVETELPPLSLRELLMFMTGIAVAMSFRFSGRGQVQIDRYQIGEDYVSAVNSIGVAIALVFALWLLIRWIGGKSIALRHPGARFAVIVAYAQLVALAYALYTRAALRFDLPLPHAVYFACVFAIFGIFGLGFFWIENRAWKALTLLQALSSVLFSFPTLSIVGALVLLYSVNQDQRAKFHRHWTHHLGILVWLFSQGFPIIR